MEICESDYLIFASLLGLFPTAFRELFTPMHP
jgi:hypothetical protein